MSSSFYSQIGIPSTNSTAIQSSVNQAATSETNSAASATNSASSASASAASATSANAADVSATQSKNAAEAAETNAATSATSSATSATASSTSATQSAASAVTSANEATAAAASAVTSSTQATNAAASATSAASSLAAIGTSVTDAATSATAAASTLTTFQNQYLGAAATAPTLDPDGSALDLGDLWFDTASDTLKVYASGGWVNAGSSVNGTSERQTYTATAGQTTFAVTYDAGFVDVWLNGVKLLVGTDFTATSGSNIVLASGAATGDIIDIIAFGTFSLSTHLSQTDSDARYVNVSGDTMTGDLTVNGNLNVAGTTVTIDSANAQTVDLGDNDKIRMGDGDDLQIYHDGSNSYVDDTGTGRLYLRGNDRVQIQKYTGEDMITANADGAVNLYHDNSKKFETTATGVDVTGTVTADGLTVDGTSGYVRIQDLNASVVSGTDMGGIEWRTADSTVVGANRITATINVEGDGTFNASDKAPSRLVFSTHGTSGVSPVERMRIDASGNVKIGDSTTDVTSKLTVSGNASADVATFMYDGSAGTYFDIDCGAANGAVTLAADARSGSYPPLTFKTGATERMRIDSAGRLLIGTTTEGQNQADNLTVSDSGNMGMTLRSTDSGECSIFFSNGTSGTPEYAGSVQYIHSDNSLRVATNATERMRIDSDGRVMFSEMVYSSYPTNNSSIKIGRGTDVNMIVVGYGGGHTVVQFKHNGDNVVGSIHTSATATTYNTSSDYRLKENVANISDGITRVKQLSPKRFNFIADADKTVDGFLAHEAATVIPEAVTGEKDGLEVWTEKEKDELPDGVSVGDNKLDDDGNTIPLMQGIDQSKIVPLLTAALQEAITKIETLETKVAALEAE